MVDEQPALGRLDRNRAAADLGGLPGILDRRHHVPMLTPVGQIGALAVKDLSERSVAVIRRPREHREVAVDFAREEDAVSVEGQEGVLVLVEALEVLRPADSDRGPVVAVAPGHVVAIIDPDDPRVVAVDELCDLRLVALEPERLRVELPVHTVGTKTAMHDHQTAAIIAAENACKLAFERYYRAIEDAVRARDEIAWDDWILRVAPDSFVANRRLVFPREVGDRRLIQDLNWRHAFFLAGVFAFSFASSGEKRTR